MGGGMIRQFGIGGAFLMGMKGNSRSRRLDEGAEMGSAAGDGSAGSKGRLNMRFLKYLPLLGILLSIPTGRANAQVRVGVGIGVGPVAVGIGPAPVCAYGYYPYAPYACAPYGFWGPDYFVNGVFIGAGPWFHGFPGRRFVDRDDFHGRRFDRDQGRDFRGGERFRDNVRGGEFHGGNAVRGSGGFYGNAGGGRR